MRKIREVLGLKYEAGLSARADVGRRSPSPSRVRSRPRHRQKHALLQKRWMGGSKNSPYAVKFMG